MKVRNYFLVIIFAIMILCSTAEYKYAESKSIGELDEFNEEIYDSLNQITDISKNYTINNLQMFAEYFSNGLELSRVANYFESFEKNNKMLNNESYLILEDGTFLCTSSKSTSMYDVLTQEEIEEITQLYADVKNSLTYTGHNKFIKGENITAIYMGIPLFDASHNFIGVVINDFEVDNYAYVIDKICGDKFPINVYLENNDNEIYSSVKYNPKKTLGKSITFEKEIEDFAVTVRIEENINLISKEYMIIKMIIVILLLVSLGYFIYMIFYKKEKEYSVMAAYIIFAFGLVFEVLNVFSYNSIASEIGRFKTKASMDFTEMTIEAESSKNEKDVCSLSNLMEKMLKLYNVPKENFAGFMKTYYSDLIQTAFNKTQTLATVYIYDSFGNMISIPSIEGLNYHKLPDKYLNSAKENYPNVFYKDMTDMNTQESFVFMLRPFVINDEYYGTMAYMFDDKKIDTIIREDDSMESVKKNIISRDGKMTNIKGGDSIQVFTDYDFNSDGVWDDGVQAFKTTISYTIKNKRKFNVKECISTRYSSSVIIFEDYKDIINRDIIESIFMNIFKYLLLYLVTVSVIKNNARKKEAIEKTTQEEIKIESLKDNK